jgi:4-amino-4-deoxy-L-arabinose transferase-like glycosyltransferase
MRHDHSPQRVAAPRPGPAPGGLIGPRGDRLTAAVLADPAERRHSAAAPRWRGYLVALAFGLVLACALAIRFWHLASSPAWQWDETVYYRVSVNVQHGVLAEHPTLGQRGFFWQPFLYQPPFYFLLLARWFALVGPSIYHARLLGVLLTGVMLAILFRLLRRLHGPRVALFAIIPVAFDGWLMYIERVSYLENALLVVIVTALLLYQRALERPSWHRFALAGAAVGGAMVFKQTGVYTVAAVLLCWLILRRQHQGHLLLIGTALAVAAVYVVIMIRLYDLPARDWFSQQSIVQLKRVLGVQQSGGTLSSLNGALHLLASQYRYFVPSAAVAVAALVLAARRLLRCYRQRSWEPARDNALLFSWMAAGVATFGISALRFPQYFALILIPAYCLFWTEVARRDWRPLLKGSLAAVAVLACGALFLLAVPAFSPNPLARVQQYAAAHIPRRSIVVTEQTIGDLIRQRWCTVEAAGACLAARRGQAAPMYAITWRTYLQSSRSQGDQAFARLMPGADRLTSFSGPVGTATVWLLKPPGRRHAPGR